MEIKTLVYFDLEATGLKSSGRPRISEISLVAVKSRDVQDFHSGIVNHLAANKAGKKIESILPRVIDKLTLCVYLNSFLARLPPPVCLVAHNGNLYDFPLLKAEMEHSGTELGYQLLCADSYVGIRELFKKKEGLSTPSSFSLINLHKHLLGCPPEQSHGAEADCLALLRVTAVLGEEFLNWVNANYYKFRHCCAMWKMSNQLTL